MNYKQLTKNERYQIYTLLKVGFSLKAIAAELNRHPSMISRELKRNEGLKGYRPKQAQRLARTRRKQVHKACKLTAEVIGWITRLIRQELSPQQVVAYLARHKQVQLYHETVYQWLYADKAAGGGLYKHLRIVSKPYRKRYGSYDNRGKIKNRVAIDARPKVVETRNRIGDWEGDTVIGKGRKGALLTLVERKTLYTVLARLDGKQADLLAQAAVKGMRAHQGQVHTTTFDNGLEFAEHGQIAAGLGADIYFVHPYCSWERGTNENTNGLIRQYFPKRTNFSTVTVEDITFVMGRLNDRPRASRGRKSPRELFLGQRVDLLAA